MNVIAPSIPELCRQAQELHRQGKSPEAETIYRRVLAEHPGNDAARVDLGNVLFETGRPAEAEACFRDVLARTPGFMPAWTNLGNVLADQRRWDEAERCYREVLSHAPGMAIGHNNLGNMLWGLGRFAEAEPLFREAVRLDPAMAEAHNNLGNLMRDLNRLDESEASLRTALSLRKDYANAHVNLALTLLLAGRFAEGWGEYEWRWRQKKLQGSVSVFPQPEWSGEDLAGRTLFVQAEQGFGDTLQFCRYLPRLAQQGKVVVEVQPPLVSLLSKLPGVHQVIGKGDPLPAFDVHCRMLAIPRLLGTTLETIPGDTPYIKANRRKAAAWKKRLDALPGLRVGLVWAGQPAMAADSRRSLPFARIAPFGAVKGVSFVSLQKGGEAAQAGFPITDWTAELNDFSDTAALIDGLDLVIAADTAVAHLAGALGKPVWLLNRFDRCWRWLIGREDTPWYPAMRLFTQAEPGRWDQVITRVRMALHLEAGGDPGMAFPALSVPLPNSGDLEKRAVAAVGQGNHAEAERLLRAALVLDPSIGGYYGNLAAVLRLQSRPREAVQPAFRARWMMPTDPVALHRQAALFVDLQQPYEAERAYLDVLKVAPTHPQSLMELANLLAEQGRPDEAEWRYRTLLKTHPHHAEGHKNFAVSLYLQGRLSECITAFRKALCLSPGSPDYRTALGQTYLLSGQFEAGWRHYETRKISSSFPMPVPPRGKPEWKGDPIGDRVLLVQTEQGLGDTLQFCRFLPIVGKTGRVVLEAPHMLVPLLRGLPHVERVVATGDSLPAFDMHAPLLSLPKLLGTTQDTIPAGAPYLAADERRAAAWRKRTAGLDGVKVGLVWAGGVLTPRNQQRSIPPERFAALMRMSGVSFVSLQKFQTAAGPRMPDHLPIHDWTGELADFADTAALVAALDLVIGVDTSVIHLAGALGKPVWLLNRFSPCWRWQLGRNDSLWYPTLRQFRQPRLDDWDEPLEECAAALAAFVKTARSL